MATRLPPDRHRHTCESCGQIDQAQLQACPTCSVEAVADIWQRIAVLERKVERLEHPWTNTVNLPPHIHGQSCSPPPPPASRG